VQDANQGWGTGEWGHRYQAKLPLLTQHSASPPLACKSRIAKDDVIGPTHDTWMRGQLLRKTKACIPTFSDKSSESLTVDDGISTRRIARAEMTGAFYRLSPFADWGRE